MLKVDMGIREVARAASYPVAAIPNCSHFKGTRDFQGDSCYTDIVENAGLHIKSTNFVDKLNELWDQLQQFAITIGSNLSLPEWYLRTLTGK